jgi:hypothetical protein
MDKIFVTLTKKTKALPSLKSNLKQQKVIEPPKSRTTTLLVGMGQSYIQH